jgi:3-oxoacyl-[acyl-carrier protein] reductase
MKNWILITGGSRGIGRALVIQLANRYDIIFTYKHGKQCAESLEQDCLTLPGEVRGYCCDGSDEHQVAQLASELLAAKGAPFGIIHNAGITRDALHIHQTSQDWHEVINSNLNAIFSWNQHLLQAMVERGEGCILMMSSITAIKGNIGQVAYSATKGAITGMTRSLARELARFGIRVNCLLPGVIETEMTKAMSETERKALRLQIPLRRFGQPNEIARVADFLLSPESSYITGQSLIIDGGITA